MVDDAGWWLGKRWRHVDSSLLTKRTTIYIISAAIKVGDNLLVGGRELKRENQIFNFFITDPWSDLWLCGTSPCSFRITGDEDTTTGQCPLSEWSDDVQVDHNNIYFHSVLNSCGWCYLILMRVISHMSLKKTRFGNASNLSLTEGSRVHGHGLSKFNLRLDGASRISCQHEVDEEKRHRVWK